MKMTSKRDVGSVMSAKNMARGFKRRCDNQGY